MYSHYWWFTIHTLLKEFLSRYFNKPNTHGICPFILKEEERDLLKLSYKAHDFCEEKNSLLKVLIPYKTVDENSYKCNGDPKCINNFKEYNVWIIKTIEVFFKNYIFSKSQAIPPQIHFPKNNCDVFKDETFHELVSAELDQFPYYQNSDKTQANYKENVGEQSITPDPLIQKENIPVEEDFPFSDKNELHITSLSEVPIEETSKIQSEIDNIKQNFLLQVLKHLETPQGTIKPLLEKIFLSNYNETALSAHSEYIVTQDSLHALMRIFKKNKKTKKRQVKLLRMVTSSLASKKTKFLMDKRMEDPLYNDEEIIKNIKIHESNMIKNTKTSKRKKERTKIIIEIHMEVLKEFRNEEWKFIKNEFLSICIEEFTNKIYNTHSHLKNDVLITQRSNRINDIEQQKLLWNKWIKRYGNLSEKLKKEEWFNNLKNEWKKEKAYIEEMEELKKITSNENHNFSFLEREIEILKQCLLKKGIIIEQYLEQDWFKGFEEELQNELYKFEIKETINDGPLINMEELEHKEFYQELYKYVKKKLLVKLCTLVFITILEECRKEELIYNRELYFDTSINEWKTEMDLRKKLEIAKNITDANEKFLENKENMGLMGKDNIKKEIAGWISEDNANINFTVND
ncbi:STP1 protein [Plasmodium malariae]|uniref:STP1 protein n=1 Tax=Plasmodium malariae TaxID=5858 RepID=A0A1D3JM22_PLAMA|nr:STP1 protein [Plasmodium malariae]SBT87659.1 STP1 protein [Plasmodium malariae]